jgi:phosphate uptake regulator
METRKVQLSGGTTYTISLPKSWAQEQGIESGSLVSIHPNGDGSLLVDVLSDPDADERAAVIDISLTDTDALKQQLSALYTVGYDAVTLRDRNGHSIDRQQTVESAIDGLSGFELMEATETRIQLRNLIDATNINVQKSAIRMRLVVLSMHTDAITAIADNDTELARRVVTRDSEADKLFAMVTRHFRRSLLDLREVEKLNHSRERLFEYYYVCRQFERVADHAVKMARFVDDTEMSIPEALITRLDNCGEQARSILERGADVVLSAGDIEMAHDVLAERDQLVETIDDIDRELYNHDQPEVAYVTGLLLDSIRRTAEYGANVATIGIQQTLRTDVEAPAQPPSE